MPNLNRVTLIGHLGKDVEIKYTPSGQALAKFSLGVSETWKDKQGAKQKRTEWVNCEAWGRLAEICGEYLSKGSPVYIEGRLQTDEYEKDGQKKYYTKVVMKEMQMLGQREAQETPQPKAPAPPITILDSLDDDLPF